jgi:uncharacterized protein with ATP-grasp and redox domains
MKRPAPFRMDNAFARETMAERLPGILRDVQSANADYPPPVLRALDRLHDALAYGEPILMLDASPVPPADYDAWNAAYRTQRAQFDPLTWLNAEWFFAETLLYRLLIQAVRWHETYRDPFAATKQAELNGDNLWAVLDAALAVDGDFAEKFAALLGFALWGNRVDLSHPAGSLAGQAAAEDDLLVDRRGDVLNYLGRVGVTAGNVTIHMIIDNTGTELATDCVLADALLTGGYEVVLHLKAHPTYVSDATTADMWHLLDAMTARGGPPAALADRLRQAWREERLRLVTPPFWVSSRFLWDMPPGLRAAFEGAHLVILKGDVNYRRAIGDTVWPTELSFSAVMDYFPAPLVALRSLKCDALVDVPENIVRALDARNDSWRTTGQYGVIQFAPSAD